MITSSNVYRPDAGLYHLPFINIINQEKIIVGLSNLHFRFGHISILQYTSAIFNNTLFAENGIVFPFNLILRLKNQFVLELKYKRILFDKQKKFLFKIPQDYAK